MEEINQLLQKYNNFRYEQVRSIEQHEDGSKTVILVIQDEDGQDVNDVKFIFDKVKTSRILTNDVLPMLDMTDGISIINENNLFGFALGRGTAMLHVHNAPLFIVSEEIRAEES